MAITKQKKVEVIEKLKKALADSKTVVFVNFSKLLVKDAEELRRALKGESVSYVVTKKSLLRKVLEGAGFKGSTPELEGEVALAYGEDLIAPARGVYGFQKKLDGKVQIVGGVFDGEYKSKDEMLSIASIPSLQTLRGMFVNIINSPVQRFAVALGQIAEKKQ